MCLFAEERGLNLAHLLCSIVIYVASTYFGHFINPRICLQVSMSHAYA